GTRREDQETATSDASRGPPRGVTSIGGLEIPSTASERASRTSSSNRINTSTRPARGEESLSTAREGSSSERARSRHLSGNFRLLRKRDLLFGYGRFALFLISDSIALLALIIKLSDMQYGGSGTTSFGESSTVDNTSQQQHYLHGTSPPPVFTGRERHVHVRDPSSVKSALYNTSANAIIYQASSAVASSGSAFVGKGSSEDIWGSLLAYVLLYRLVLVFLSSSCYG
ncbi:unnamed protein product, partial [Amoebophrya sp. A25]